MNKNWLIALSVIPCWSFCNVFYRYISIEYNIHTLVYASSVMLAASVGMLMIAQVGALTKDTIADKSTWVWGICQVLSNVVLIALFTFITSTEGALMTRISVLAGFVISFFYANRIPSRHDIVSILLIVGGVIAIAVNLPEEVKAQSITLMLLAGLIQAIRLYVAENHKQNIKAIKTRDRVRVTGLILGITSLMFLAVSFAFALIKDYSGLDTALVQAFPSMADMLNPWMILASIPVGLIIVGYMKYAEFHASKHIKSENFLVLTALVPVVTLAFEWIGSKLAPEVLQLSEISNTDMIAGGLMTLGVVYAALMNHDKKIEVAVATSSR